MQENIEKLEALIVEKKDTLDLESNDIKEYIEIVNELVELYISQEEWQKAEEILEDCSMLFPPHNIMIKSGIYESVGKVFTVNYYLVAKKLQLDENIKKLKSLKEQIDLAQSKDISNAQDIKIVEQANILNTINLYKKKYKTNDEANSIDLEKEKLFKELYWLDLYDNYKFSWE